MVHDRSLKDIRAKRIFLSYGHDNLISFAARLKNDLKDRGHEVWFDEERIKPGNDWEQYIEDGLKWASQKDGGCMILLMTPHSVRRPDGFCLNELSRAIYESLNILPVMLVWCEPPLSICRIQWLDMMDCTPLEERQDRYKAKFNLLVDALEQGKFDYKGFQASLINTLKPLSYDAEIKYNLNRFTGREWLLDEIYKWLTSDASRIFWISGSPGVGKSSISAWLCVHMREVFAFHFCRYDNVQKTDPRRCVMSIAYQLSTQLPEYAERLKAMSLENLSGLNAKTLFDNLIVQPLWGIQKPDRKVVIIIDGLDEATLDGKNDLASFLASELERAPVWVRLIITSRPEYEIIGPMQAYTPFILDISDSRNVQDIRDYLSIELKKYNRDRDVPGSQIEAIVNKSEGLFLYTEWILKELAMGRLSLDRLDEFPQGLGGIYLKFFERQFPDSQVWETQIRKVLEVIVALQEPLDLKMISKIFNWSVHDERNFRRSLGSLFYFEKGMVLPFHKSLMEWLTNEDKLDPYFISATEGHKTLADYGLRQYKQGESVWSRYVLLYIYIHLYRADMMKELEEVLGDVHFIKAVWDKDTFNMLKQWTFIEEHTPLRMEQVYRRVIDNPQTMDDKYLIVLAKLMESTFHFDIAMRLFDYLTTYYRKSGNMYGLQESIGDQALILYTKSDFEHSMILFKEQEKICRSIGNTTGLQYSIQNQANILINKNDTDNAVALLKEQENICRNTDNMNGLLESLAVQCGILRFKGYYDDVMNILEEREKICGQTNNTVGYLRCIFERGLTLSAMGKLDSALDQLIKLEKICREIGNKEYLRASLIGQEIALVQKGDLEKAIKLNHEEELISRRIGSKYDLQECLCQRAVELRLKGDLDGALKCIDEAELLCQDINNKFGLQALCGEKGSILRLKEDLDNAHMHYREQEKICREIGHRRDLAVCLYGQAAVLRMKGDLKGALALHAESEHILREIGHIYYLQECLGEKALTLLEMGDLDSATVTLKEQESICIKIGARRDLQICLKNRIMVEEKKAEVSAIKEPAFHMK